MSRFRSISLVASACALALAGACKSAPKPELLYVSAEQSGEIVVIDPAKAAVVTKIAVGKRPRGLRLSPDQKFLYVALSGSPRGGPGVDESKLPPPDRSADGIGVIDLEKHKLVKTIAGGNDPENFDLSKDGKYLYVANEDSAELSVVDIDSGKVVKKVAVGTEPEGVGLAPDGKTLYVTSEGDGAVTAVDTSTLTAATKVETGKRPRNVIFTRDGKWAFVTNEMDGTVTVVDPKAQRAFAQIAVTLTQGPPQRPMGLVLSPDEKKLFVTSGRGGAVGVVDVDTRTFDRLIPDVGARPWGIGISQDGARLYTANGPSDDISIIDVKAGKVTTRVKVSGQPWGIVVSPAKS
jgi:YVTN family beta-propeller protein